MNDEGGTLNKKPFLHPYLFILHTFLHPDFFSKNAA